MAKQDALLTRIYKQVTVLIKHPELQSSTIIATVSTCRDAGNNERTFKNLK